MILKISIPIKPISLNHCDMSLRNGRRIKTKEYKIFENLTSAYINQHRTELRIFAQQFMRSNTLHAEYSFNLSTLMTKDGYINKRSGDLDNFIKPIQDILFKHLKTYNSEIDDSHITEIHACKWVNTKDSIEIKIGAR